MSADYHDPIPICLSNPGCPAMVRRGEGQWTACPGEPAWAVLVPRRGEEDVLVFPCEAHRGLLEGARPMTEYDRRVLAWRRAEWARLTRRAAPRSTRPGSL